MIKDIHFPTKLKGAALDAYLAMGWYRLGQIIFTTDFIQLDETLIRVFWLRFQLAALQYSKKQKQVINAAQAFTVNLLPFSITTEMIELYNRYKTSINFEAPETLEGYLFDGVFDAEPRRNVFDSMKFEIRDGEKLVAAGIFDKGDSSIAGIINFYDPAYKKFSLGKYLMLLKINYARATGKTWYYPGYIAHGFSKFDYKLFPGTEAAELLDMESGEWKPYDAFEIFREGK
jgi:arginine-tRNA-protein transferase